MREHAKNSVKAKAPRRLRATQIFRLSDLVIAIRCVNSCEDASPNRAILGALLRTKDQARIEISEPASSTLFLLVYKSGPGQSRKKPFNVEDGVEQPSRIVAQDDCTPTFPFRKRLPHTAPADTNTMRMRAPIS